MSARRFWRSREMRIACLASIGALFALTACGSSGLEEASEATEQDVVGGRPESGYPAVGFLHDNTAPEYPAICAVTLIAKDVVVTAAHCVDTSTPNFSVGWGKVTDT